MKIIILIVSFLATHMLAAENIAIVKFAKGSVKIKRQENIIQANVGYQLQVKDIVVTEKDSSAGIIFDDGSSLTLGENSYIAIEEFVFKPLEQEFDFNLYIEKGKTVFKSGKIGKLAPDNFQMRIPRGIIGIRGTKFLVDVE